MVVLFEKNGLQNFQKFFEDAPEIIKYKKQRNYAVNLNRKIEAEYFQFLCFLHFIISGLFEISALFLKAERFRFVLLNFVVIKSFMISSNNFRLERSVFV